MVSSHFGVTESTLLGDNAEIKTLRTCWHLAFLSGGKQVPKSLSFFIGDLIMGEENRQRFLNNNCLKILTDAVQLKPGFYASEVIEWKKTATIPYVFVQEKNVVILWVTFCI